MKIYHICLVIQIKIIYWWINVFNLFKKTRFTAIYVQVVQASPLILPVQYYHNTRMYYYCQWSRLRLGVCRRWSFQPCGCDLLFHCRHRQRFFLQNSLSSTTTLLTPSLFRVRQAHWQYNEFEAQANRLASYLRLVDVLFIMDLLLGRTF